MKHTFDETTMQAAIDAACEALGKGDFRPTAGLLDTVPGCHDWKEETSARLHLLKSALDFLPEPPPPVVDGKTPGQVCHESMYNTPEWKWLLAGDKAACESAASAVLAAFGKPQLSTLRPISEAGDVPAGCVRYYFTQHPGFFGTGAQSPSPQDTHFADIRLPEAIEAAKKEKSYVVCARLDCPEKITHYEGSCPECTVKPTPETFTAHGKEWTPAVGDVVTLKSDGPKMTVLDPHPICYCSWFSNGEFYSNSFPASTLIPA
jgi:uncharacterized protein YodC (DUF2158 family)